MDRGAVLVNETGTSEVGTQISMKALPAGEARGVGFRKTIGNVEGESTEAGDGE